MYIYEYTHAYLLHMLRGIAKHATPIFSHKKTLLVYGGKKNTPAQPPLRFRENTFQSHISLHALPFFES